LGFRGGFRQRLERPIQLDGLDRRHFAKLVGSLVPCILEVALCTLQRGRCNDGS
jgi:hypothetical protein